MWDLLFLGREFHVVTISGGEVFNVATHGFVSLALKRNVHATCNARAGEASLDFGTYFREVAHVF